MVKGHLTISDLHGYSYASIIIIISISISISILFVSKIFNFFF